MLVETRKHIAHVFAQHDSGRSDVSGGKRTSHTYLEDVDFSNFTLLCKPLCTVYIMATDMKYSHNLSLNITLCPFHKSARDP